MTQDTTWCGPYSVTATGILTRLTKVSYWSDCEACRGVGKLYLPQDGWFKAVICPRCRATGGLLIWSQA